ncbi:MAG: T9SS type A sorting domain-containing protein [Flavobacteriales bacterium]
MRITTALFSALLFSAAQAQETVTVSLTPGSAEQLWYSLTDGTQGHTALAGWDLAFEINGGSNAAVLVNTAGQDHVYQSPYTVAQWDALDTNGLADSWVELQNSDTTWSVGALNQNLNGPFDLGWGVYNMATHVVAGDSIFVVKLSNGDWKKLRVDGLSSGTYTFTYADLDGGMEQTGSITKSNYPGKNFAYWSMTTNAAIDREPVSSSWDLLFTKYYTDLGIMWYSVTGVLQNKGVEVAQVGGVPPSEASPDGAVYSTDIHTIGHDWKNYSFSAGAYVVSDTLTYFVKDVHSNLWKVVFTAFTSSTGDFTFTKELVGHTGITEQAAAGQVVVYPNPVSNGQAQLVLDVPATQADVLVYDLSGKQVISTRFGGLTPLTVRSMDVSALTAGTYVLRVQHAQGAIISKLIVQ